MKKIKIPIPEGFELNLQESDKNNAIVQEKVKYPKSWEEFNKNLNSTEEVWVLPNYGNVFREQLLANGYYYNLIYPTQEMANQFTAYSKLMILRREWIHIWSQEHGLKEDWRPGYNVYAPCIYITYDNDGSIGIGCASCGLPHPLSFPSETLANNFRKDFAFLLEQAKGLY